MSCGSSGGKGGGKGGGKLGGLGTSIHHGLGCGGSSGGSGSLGVGGIAGGKGVAGGGGDCGWPAASPHTYSSQREMPYTVARSGKTKRIALARGRSGRIEAFQPG